MGTITPSNPAATRRRPSNRPSASPRRQARSNFTSCTQSARCPSYAPNRTQRDHASRLLAHAAHPNSVSSKSPTAWPQRAHASNTLSSVQPVLRIRCSSGVRMGDSHACSRAHHRGDRIGVVSVCGGSIAAGSSRVARASRGGHTKPPGSRPLTPRAPLPLAAGGPAPACVRPDPSGGDAPSASGPAARRAGAVAPPGASGPSRPARR